MKKVITPGRLYSKLRHEFHKRRHPECAHCNLPLPFCLDKPMNNANWNLGQRFRECDRCGPLIVELIREYQGKYDLFDLSRSASPPSQPSHRGARI